MTIKQTQHLEVIEVQCGKYNFFKKILNKMACGCKNKVANANNNVVKTSSPLSQGTKPQKSSNGTRIIKREIR